MLVVFRLGLVRGTSDDVFGKAVEQGQSSGDNAPGAVDALQTRTDGFGIALYLPDELSAFFEQCRYPAKLAAKNVEEERQASNEKRDRDDGERNKCVHERTFS